MLSEGEIDDLLRQVGSKDRVVEADTVSPADGQLMAGDADGLVTGNVLAGGVAESQKNIVVAGTVIGDSDHRCRIEAKAQVLLHAGAQYAHVVGERILIEENVDHCTLVSSQAIQIGGDVSISIIVMGEFRSRQQRWLRLEREVVDAEKSRDNVQMQLKFNSRRVLKTSKNTQVAFDLNLGSVMVVRAIGLKIDLKPIYAVLKGENRASRDKAIEDFFDRVVIASLTKANTTYIATNKGRREVFLKILTQLRELFQMAREVDRLSEEFDAITGESQALLESFKNPAELTLTVSGRLGEGTEIEFVIPDVCGEDGQVSIERTSAKMSVTAGETAGVYEITTSDPSGQQTRQQVARAELTGVAVSCSDGELGWQPVAGRELVA